MKRWHLGMTLVLALPAPALDPGIAAFPGAQGAGQFSTGGRGGMEAPIHLDTSTSDCRTGCPSAALMVIRAQAP